MQDTLSSAAVEQRFQTALALVMTAGERLLEARASRNFQLDYKAHQELVTSLDREIDTLICEALQQAFPQDVCLSEENHPQTEGVLQLPAAWVLDPIDGTVNFAHGQPHVAVSLAFYHYGKPLLGLVHAPYLRETFTAIRGQGAQRNGQPIRCSQQTDFSRALIATGFPYDKSRIAPLVQRLAHLLPACRDLRRCGSAALDICHVADGSLDGYYESLSLWDFAAAVLIAEEAGARLDHLHAVAADNFYLDTRDWVISAPPIHPRLIQLLQQADASQKTV